MSVFNQAAEMYAHKQPFGLFRQPWGRLTLIKSVHFDRNGSAVFGKYRVRRWPFDLPNDEHKDAPFTSTSHDEYISEISRLIASFRKPTDKTVIVRKIAGEVPADFVKNEIFGHRLKTYFDQFIVDFLYAFYTPETGLWLGASPELLLRRYRNGGAYTQALAGTRPFFDSEIPWSDKDLQEHAIVVKDIVNRLNKKWAVSVHPQNQYCYGALSHLRTKIDVDCPENSYNQVLEALYPTPAICGYPMDAAIGNIQKFERFPREFYTGVIGYSNKDIDVDYAILRCAHVDGDKYEIFTGSGIISDSDPEAEWNETEAKATPLLRLFCKEEK